MQAERHLNDTEFGEALAGGAPAAREHLAACGDCSAALQELAGLRDGLRADLQKAAERPGHFWRRQQANIHARLHENKRLLRWPVAAMAGLALLSFALLNINTPAPLPAHPAQTADADDLLLKDIQRSLAHRAPEPLMPASVLVQEMTTDPRNVETREN